ncbi:MAG: patatin family protein [Lachnospira sp.]|uniref:Predicted phospholipase, patatin/cPLA2 family n=1 Tax=Lachnospira pectinoschiza TaxID=28052 RepID=A0A1G9YFB6_9FIRM|nr:patatin family protein [Lachnospira pectinoschiza]MCR5516792.1 patatin family protein [Lachnospira sp.]SDN07720.1 Predicted phospholipase, patatin/cPLA2 family [Lachnospira pectinoschiza]
MKTGIVFEGGAFRSIYSCGVMDALLELDFMPDYIIGVSAGAAYAASYASKQVGRNLKIIMDYRDDKRYMGLLNMLDPGNRSLYGLDFAYETIPNELVPFDYDTFREYKGEFYCVVTNVETGKPEYLPYTGLDKTNTVLKATCALPVFFPYININGTNYMDGGLSDSIPVERALADGCDKLLVVLTREPGYTKTTSSVTKQAAKIYKNKPELARDLLTRADKYNRQLERLDRLEREGKAYVMRPVSTKGFKRTEKDKTKILSLYNDGYNQTYNQIEAIRDFFKA